MPTPNPGEIAEVRDAIITYLKSSSALVAEVAATYIDYGLGPDITTDLLPKSIRIVSKGIGEDVAIDWAAGIQKYHRPYLFNIVGIFGLQDGETEKTAEDRASLWDYLIRQALGKYIDLGGTVMTTEFGRTWFFSHATMNGVKMVLIEFTATKSVTVS